MKALNVLLLLTQVLIVSTYNPDLHVIRGEIRDFFTNEPISHARILLLNENITIFSDRRGMFSLNVSRFPATLLIYHADVNGYDYMPAKVRLNGSFSPIIVYLVPCGNLMLNGSLVLVEPAIVVRYFTIHVMPQGVLPKYTLLDFGAFSEASSILGLPANEALVPANVPFSICLRTYLEGEQLPYLSELSDIPVNEVLEDVIAMRALARGISTITFPTNGSLKVKRMESLHLRLEDIVIRNYLVIYEDIVLHIKNILNKLYESGLYLGEEIALLNKASRYLKEASELSGLSAYPDALISIRKAYMDVIYVMSSISRLLREARVLLLIISIITSLISAMVVSIFVEHRLLRYLASTSTSYVLLLLFFAVLPPLRLFIVTVDALFLIPAILSPCFLWLLCKPYIYLRLMKGDLKSRFSRHMLTVLSITLLAVSLTVFTSISFKQALYTHKTGISLPSGSFFVRGATPSGIFKQYLIEALGLKIKEAPLRELDPSFLSMLKDLGARRLSPLVVSLPALMPLTFVRSPLRDESLPLYGLIGFDPINDPLVNQLRGGLLKGDLSGLNGRGIAISESLAESLGLDLRSRVVLYDEEYEVVAIIRDKAIYNLHDIDRSRITPMRIVIEKGPGGRPIYALAYCLPDEIVVLNWKKALTLPYTSITRIFAFSSDPEKTAMFLALNLNSPTLYSKGGSSFLVFMTLMADIFGVEFLVPILALAFLLVFSSALNTVYERRHEAKVLLAVGMNPSQLTVLFMVEYLLLGLTGGFSGYIIGLTIYRFLPLWGMGLALSAKYSWYWPPLLISLCGAFSALAALIPALRASRITTPSLRRKWRFDSYDSAKGEYELRLPITIPTSMVNDLLGFLRHNMSSYRSQYISFTDLSLRSIPSPSLSFLIVQYGEGPVRAKGTITCRERDGLCDLLLRIKCLSPNPPRRKWEFLARRFLARRLSEPVSLIRMWILRWATRNHQRP